MIRLLKYVDIHSRKLWPEEVGIYKRKQENKNSAKKAIKKTRNQELDQEKKKKKSFFLTTFLVKLLFSFINSHLRFYL